MAGNILDTLAQPVSGVLGSIINGIFGNQQQKKNMQFQREMNQVQFGQQQQLMDKAFGQSVDMFNMTNEYNTPAAQVQRLEDAGLNPAYLFGQGSPATPVISTSPQAPSTSPPNFQNPFDFSEIGKNVGQGLDRLLEKQRVANESEKTRAEVAKLAASTQVDYALEQLTLNQADTEWIKQDELRQNIAESMIRGRELDSRIEVNKQSARNFESMIQDRLIQQGFKQQDLEIQWYSAITERMNAETQRQVGIASIKAYEAQANKDNATAHYTKESLSQLYMNIWDSYNHAVKGEIDLKYYDNNCKVQYECNKGQLRLINLEGDFQDKTMGARVANEFINTGRNAIGAVSDCVDLGFDFATFGLRKSLVGNQGKFYGKMSESNSPMRVTGFSVGGQ